MKEKAANLLCMNANKKPVQQQISQETGKVVLLKDLSNIAAKAKERTTKNDLDSCVSLLMNKYGEQKNVKS